MRKQQVPLDDGKSVEVREMTWGEAKAIEEDGATAAPKLPMVWPLEQQFKGREAELASLGVSEVRKLAEAVYGLTFGRAEG